MYDYLGKGDHVVMLMMMMRRRRMVVMSLTELTCSEAHVGTARPTKADPVLAWVYFIDEDEDADDDEDNANDNQQLHPP